MDFADLQTKTDISENNSLQMIVYRPVNKHQIASRTRLNVLQQFYLNTTILDNMRKAMAEFKTAVTNIIAKVAKREYVDINFISKKDANFKKSKLLTESNFNELLKDYCTEKKIDIDIEVCKSSARASATSLANYLGLMGVNAKFANSNNLTNTNNTGLVIEQMSESGDE